MAGDEWATPERIAMARLSPAGWAVLTGRGLWKLAPHLAVINRAVVDAVMDGVNLLVEMPPRHGKSELISRALPGWFLGRWPGKRVLHTTYGLELCQQFGRMIRADLEEFGPEVWGIQVDPASRAAHRFGLVGHAGMFFGVGVGGGLTGRGGDLLITDDTVKDAEAARSDLQREHLWEWFTSTFLTRRQPGAIHIGMMTRWHEDDLHGRILDRVPDRYRLLRAPAICEAADDLMGREVGDPLWPEMYPLEALEEIRRDQPPMVWSALYQQRPTPEEGGVWKRAWWDDCRYGEREGRIVFDDDYMPTADSLSKFTVVDLAFSEKKTADFTTIGTYGVTPESPRRCAILGMVEERMEYPAFKQRLSVEMERHGSRVVYVEEEGQQSMVVQDLRDHGLPVKTISRREDADLKVSGDKVNVAHEATPFAAAGRLWIPKRSSWTDRMEHQLLTFPNATNDDIADNVAWGCLVADRMPHPLDYTREAPKPCRRCDGLGCSWCQGENDGRWGGMAPKGDRPRSGGLWG